LLRVRVEPELVGAFRLHYSHFKRTLCEDQQQKIANL
jgi:hypothetical protein